MLFNSGSFLLFFPIVTASYFMLPHRFRWALLLAASCVFYCAFIPAYLAILVFTITVDYFAGLAIERARGPRRKHLLWISLVANVGVLAVFKYCNFLLGNLQVLGHALHLGLQLPLLNMVLPIGLSFHTFQAMSYTIEVYRGRQRAERHFGIYALYVMFYPQLVAGPIERPQNLLHQFRAVHRFSANNLLAGLRLMAWGMFKKVVIADRVASYVNCVYARPGDYHYLNLIIATLLFSVQIYCDFSGYSDTAIGAAKTMGFELMTNFQRPYFASNIQEFWRRWHISLSTWFKDYVYLPLGGSRRGARRMYLSLIAVFLLSGLWHGANWTFVVWGALHALLIVLYLVFKKDPYYEEVPSKVASTLSALATFLAVSFAWIFFRASNVRDAALIVTKIFGRKTEGTFQLVVTDPTTHVEFGSTSLLITTAMIALVLVVERRLPPLLTALDRKPLADLVFCSAVLFLIISFGFFNQTGFIYFQF